VSQDSEKQLVGARAALLVESGMRVGLGTGTTVDRLLVALSKRRVKAVYVASSLRTEQAALALGLEVESFDANAQLDLAIDGADQITEEGWLVKGAGGALTREKIVATSAARFVVIGDSTKIVDALRAPVPVELLVFGLSSTLARLVTCVVRDAPPSPDGGIIGDYFGEMYEPEVLASKLAQTPGVVEHGLFAPELVSEVFVGVDENVRHIVVRGKHE
jgi:ribose 5-phosphate isomerase A